MEVKRTPQHIRQYCSQNAGSAAPNSNCVREQLGNYNRVFAHMRESLNKQNRDKPWRDPSELVQNCRLRFGPSGPQWEQHCNHVPLFIYNSPYIYEPYPVRLFDGPDFIYNFCVAQRRIQYAINRCLSTESQLLYGTEAYLRREIGDEQARENILQTCIDRHANQGMSWVEHCARSEASYRRMFP
jgi:hypothetical protein